MLGAKHLVRIYVPLSGFAMQLCAPRLQQRAVNTLLHERVREEVVVGIRPDEEMRD